jgi:hypothetical protein
MRMMEEDARTRRDHYRRGGSATEYDALHGLGVYVRKPSDALRALVQRLLGRRKSDTPAANKTATTHTW